MLAIDSFSNITIDLDQVCALDAQRVSDVSAMRRFAGGLRLGPQLLDAAASMTPPPESGNGGMFGAILHQLLPTVYDADYLDAQGGVFGLRILGVGDFTFSTLNHRVVVLDGLPRDVASGDDVVDLAIAPDAFMAYARGLLLSVSEAALADDDEYENRPLSHLELQLHGLPAGGADPYAVTHHNIIAPWNAVQYRLTQIVKPAGQPLTFVLDVNEWRKLTDYQLSVLNKYLALGPTARELEQINLFLNKFPYRVPDAHFKKLDTDFASYKTQKLGGKNPWETGWTMSTVSAGGGKTAYGNKMFYNYTVGTDGFYLYTGTKGEVTGTTDSTTVFTFFRNSASVGGHGVQIYGLQHEPNPHEIAALQGYFKVAREQKDLDNLARWFNEAVALKGMVPSNYYDQLLEAAWKYDTLKGKGLLPGEAGYAKVTGETTPSILESALFTTPNKTNISVHHYQQQKSELGWQTTTYYPANTYSSYHLRWNAARSDWTLEVFGARFGLSNYELGVLGKYLDLNPTAAEVTAINNWFDGFMRTNRIPTENWRRLDAAFNDYKTLKGQGKSPWADSAWRAGKSFYTPTEPTDDAQFDYAEGNLTVFVRNGVPYSKYGIIVENHPYTIVNGGLSNPDKYTLTISDTGGQRASAWQPTHAQLQALNRFLAEKPTANELLSLDNFMNVANAGKGLTNEHWNVIADAAERFEILRDKAMLPGQSKWEQVYANPQSVLSSYVSGNTAVHVFNGTRAQLGMPADSTRHAYNIKYFPNNTQKYSIEIYGHNNELSAYELGVLNKYLGANPTANELTAINQYLNNFAITYGRAPTGNFKVLENFFTSYTTAKAAGREPWLDAWVQQTAIKNPAMTVDAYGNLLYSQGKLFVNVMSTAKSTPFTFEAMPPGHPMGYTHKLQVWGRANQPTHEQLETIEKYLNLQPTAKELTDFTTWLNQFSGGLPRNNFKELTAYVNEYKYAQDGGLLPWEGLPDAPAGVTTTDKPLPPANTSVCAVKAATLCGNNTGNYSACGYFAPRCGTAAGGLTACGTATGDCGVRAGFLSSRGINYSTCGVAFGALSACAVDAGACGVNSGIPTAYGAKANACAALVSFASACGAFTDACGAKLSFSSACGAKSGACGAQLSYGNVCAAQASVACGARVAGISACAAEVSICGAKLATGACGAEARVCGVDLAQACAAYAGACGINLPGDIVSACTLNIIPLAPSC